MMSRPLWDNIFLFSPPGPSPWWRTLVWAWGRCLSPCLCTDRSAACRMARSSRTSSGSCSLAAPRTSPSSPSPWCSPSPSLVSGSTLSSSFCPYSILSILFLVNHSLSLFCIGSSWCNVYIGDGDKCHSWPCCHWCWVSGSLAHTGPLLTPDPSVAHSPAWPHMGEWRAQSAEQRPHFTSSHHIPAPAPSASFTQFYQFFYRSTAQRSERENSAWCNWLYKRVYMQTRYISITCENTKTAAVDLKLMGVANCVIFLTEIMFCVIDYD